MDSIVDPLIAARLRALRSQSGSTLEALADKAQVSRAQISKIERGEVSPSAAILHRLANALGVTLSALFEEEGASQRITRAADRQVWTDPASGYSRVNVAPRGRSRTDIVDVVLPPDTRVHCDNFAAPPVEQFVWVLDGCLSLTVGAETSRLLAGDCQIMRLDEPITFANETAKPTRYAVILVPDRGAFG